MGMDLRHGLEELCGLNFDGGGLWRYFSICGGVAY